MRRVAASVSLAVLTGVGVSVPAVVAAASPAPAVPAALPPFPIAGPIQVDLSNMRARTFTADTAWVATAATRGPAIVRLRRRSRDTVVAVEPENGRPITTAVAGSWRFPVAVRGEPPVPISADGSTLVLEDTSGGRYALLDAALSMPPRLHAVGAAYTFDAVSPSGDRLYLTEHRGVYEYAVRTYVAATATFDPQPVVVKGEPTSVMAGEAKARAATPSGTWVFTLYERTGSAPFIHAINTREGWSHCIDLPRLPDVAGASTRWAVSSSADGSKVFAANTAHGVVFDAQGDLKAPQRIRSAPVARSAARPVLSGPQAEGASAMLGTADGLYAVRADSLGLEVRSVAAGVAVERLSLSPDGSTALTVNGSRARAINTGDGSVVRPGEASRRLGREVVYT